MHHHLSSAQTALDTASQTSTAGPRAVVTKTNTSFVSACELAQCLKGLGKDFYVVQLSSGPLQGHFSVLHLEGISLLKISTNQILLLNGNRGEDCISFCLECTGNSKDHRVQCQSFDPFGLYGFNQNLRESHFQLSAGSVSLIAISSARRFNNLLTKTGHEHLIEPLLASNSLSLDPDRHKNLCQHIQALIENPPLTLRNNVLSAQTLFTAIIESLQSRSNYFTPFVLSTRNELVRELVRWSTLNLGSHASLDQICEQLYTSRRTLILGTKDNFACGPMELLRTIRLQQVNTLLRSPEARQQHALYTVSDISEHCGFRSRGHFARAYRTHFDETPRATLINSLM